MCQSTSLGNTFSWSFLLFLFLPLLLLPPSSSPLLPSGRDMFLSASVPVTLLHVGSQSGRSPLSSSILFASKIVCTWKMWSCVAPSCRRRWNSVESLMHTNLCRWCSYCWKMDCLIKHIIRHICCLASQIEVVFCTNFLVKFVNVHVIFALGHRARCKFLASLLVASQFRLFLTMKWISLRIRHSLYGEGRKTAQCGPFFFSGIFFMLSLFSFFLLLPDG